VVYAGYLVKVIALGTEETQQQQKRNVNNEGEGEGDAAINTSRDCRSLPSEIRFKVDSTVYDKYIQYCTALITDRWDCA
jgi:hypothetical protein